MLELHSIAPVVESASITTAGYQSFLESEFEDLADVRVVGHLLRAGPVAVESSIDEAFAIPDLLRVGLEAQAAGARGVVIDCMLDPGLAALRCALKVPVMGVAEIAFRLAATLGHAFGVVDIGDSTGPIVEQQVRCMGLADRFAGVRGIGLRVIEVAAQRDAALARLVEVATCVIRDDGADVLVLGCTEFSRYGDELRRRLLGRGLDVPVINPTRLALGTLLAVVRAGAGHSKRAYPTPARRKRLHGYDLPGFYDSAEVE